MKLAIIAGSGVFPRLVADAARANGHEVQIAALAGACSEGDFPGLPLKFYKFGQLSSLLKDLRRTGTREVLMIGAMPRPEFSYSALKPEWGTLWFLPKLAKSFKGGDDGLLRGIVSLFEDEGFTVRNPAEIAPALVAPLGPIGARAHTKVAKPAIEAGFEFLDAMSAFDVGQAVVVKGERIVAVEAAEGTAAMLERVANLVEAGRLRFKPGEGVLVKAPKRSQDLRVDMPAIGLDTVAAAAKIGLAGIALRASAVLIGERADLRAAADKASIFVEGFA